MLDIYKSKGFIKKVVQVKVQVNTIAQRMRHESSFQDEWFSFYEGKTAIFCKELQFFKTSTTQGHGLPLSKYIKMKLCLNCSKFNLHSLKMYGVVFVENLLLRGQNGKKSKKVRIFEICGNRKNTPIFNQRLSPNGWSEKKT